jgi:hypothetical protein
MAAIGHSYDPMSWFRAARQHCNAVSLPLALNLGESAWVGSTDSSLRKAIRPSLRLGSPSPTHMLDLQELCDPCHRLRSLQPTPLRAPSWRGKAKRVKIGKHNSILHQRAYNNRPVVSKFPRNSGPGTWSRSDHVGGVAIGPIHALTAVVHAVFCHLVMALGG